MGEGLFHKMGIEMLSHRTPVKTKGFSVALCDALKRWHSEGDSEWEDGQYITPGKVNPDRYKPDAYWIDLKPRWPIVTLYEIECTNELSEATLGRLAAVYIYLDGESWFCNLVTCDKFGEQMASIPDEKLHLLLLLRMKDRMRKMNGGAFEREIGQWPGA